jgi:hypothetical protein
MDKKLSNKLCTQNYYHHHQKKQKRKAFMIDNSSNSSQQLLLCLVFVLGLCTSVGVVVMELAGKGKVSKMEER